MVKVITHNIYFKDIPGYEGYYQVSNTGLVKSLARRRIGKFGGEFKSRILKPSIRGGYLNVTLHKDRIKTSPVGIHRLVAITFIPNPENKSQVNHKDGNKCNNRIHNLEWCSSGDNLIHAYRELGRKVNKTGTGKFGELHHNSRKIIQYSMDGERIKEWANAVAVERELGFDRRNIYACVNGKTKSSHGFLWLHEDKYITFPTHE